MPPSTPASQGSGQFGRVFANNPGAGDDIWPVQQPTWGTSVDGTQNGFTTTAFTSTARHLDFVTKTPETGDGSKSGTPEILGATFGGGMGALLVLGVILGTVFLVRRRYGMRNLRKRDSMEKFRNDLKNIKTSTQLLRYRKNEKGFKRGSGIEISQGINNAAYNSLQRPRSRRKESTLESIQEENSIQEDSVQSKRVRYKTQPQRIREENECESELEDNDFEEPEHQQPNINKTVVIEMCNVIGVDTTDSCTESTVVINPCAESEHDKLKQQLSANPSVAIDMLGGVEQEFEKKVSENEPNSCEHFAIEIGEELLDTTVNVDTKNDCVTHADYAISEQLSKPSPEEGDLSQEEGGIAQGEDVVSPEGEFSPEEVVIPQEEGVIAPVLPESVLTLEEAIAPGEDVVAQKGAISSEEVVISPEDGMIAPVLLEGVLTAEEGVIAPGEDVVSPEGEFSPEGVISPQNVVVVPREDIPSSGDVNSSGEGTPLPGEGVVGRLFFRNHYSRGFSLNGCEDDDLGEEPIRNKYLYPLPGEWLLKELEAFNNEWVKEQQFFTILDGYESEETNTDDGCNSVSASPYYITYNDDINSLTSITEDEGDDVETMGEYNCLKAIVGSHAPLARTNKPANFRLDMPLEQNENMEILSELDTKENHLHWLSSNSDSINTVSAIVAQRQEDASGLYGIYIPQYFPNHSAPTTPSHTIQSVKCFETSSKEEKQQENERIKQTTLPRRTKRFPQTSLRHNMLNPLELPLDMDKYEGNLAHLQVETITTNENGVSLSDIPITRQDSEGFLDDVFDQYQQTAFQKRTSVDVYPRMGIGAVKKFLRD